MYRSKKKLKVFRFGLFFEKIIQRFSPVEISQFFSDLRCAKKQKKFPTMDEAPPVVDFVDVGAPGEFAVPLPAYPHPPPLHYNPEFDDAGDDGLAEAMDDMEISASQQVRNGIPKLKDFYAYQAMVSLLYFAII